MGLYNEQIPITKEEIEDMKKIASSSSSTSSYYQGADGKKFSVADVVTGKVKLPEKYTTASKADEISDPNYGIKNVRGVK